MGISIYLHNKLPSPSFFFFFFNDTATTEIYTLSLHDALPICRGCRRDSGFLLEPTPRRCSADRKSTRLNSSHVETSYAVFCLKKKKNTTNAYFILKKKNTTIKQRLKIRQT